MVNPAGTGPQQVVFQQTAPIAQQEVRARNEQTQPRQAPSANSQNAGQRELQSSDDRDSNGKGSGSGDDNNKGSNSAAALPTSGRRGSLLDLTA